MDCLLWAFATVGQSAWAFATVGQSDAALFAALAKDAKQRLNGFNVQELANTA